MSVRKVRTKCLTWSRKY